jgi:acyl-CoA synthetase (AMP-forming)/AMP-acid ligase II/acyl carrier protein
VSPRSSPTTRARAVGDLASLLRLRAELAPEQVAYRFLDGDGPPDEITYAQLMARAAALGARVASASRRGDRVMLMLPPGIDYVVGLFACLAAGRVAVPAYPPDRRRLAQSLQRLEAVCADASAALALAAPEALALLASSEAQLPCLAGLGRLEAAAPANDGAGAPLPDARPHDVAILHYTSGSTSAPKGVVLGHDNLLANLEHIRRAFEQTPETRAVFWLPPYHDMGLVGAILEPLYAGYPSVLMSPFDFVARPARWLEEIGRWRATTSGGPNFAYDLCVRKTTVEERERLDLSSWTLAFNGSEPVRAGTLTRFAAAFAPAGFRASAFLPCYGLAEATLLVASARVGERPRVHAVDRGALAAGRLEPGETQLVSSGHPVEGLVVAIADPASGTAVPDGTVGEIWVSAPSVARGYWRRPNDRAFESRLPVHPGRRFLRTGDLGAVVGGELVVAGREKDVIVVRGRNVHPHDVELAAERAHPAIRPGGTAAFAAADATEEDARITIVCEVEAARGPVDAEALGRAVRRSVAERCDVVIASVVLVAPGHVPKTSSGKVRRRACRSSLSSGALTPIAESRAHWRPREPPDGREIAAASGRERIALARELIVALAARRGAPAANGAQSLLDLVTDSVEAMELAADLQSALGVEVRLEQVLGPVPLDELAAHVAELVGAAAPRPSAADPGALSEGQEALWLLQRLAPASSAYHLSVALRLHGRLNAEALARALALLTARHSLLRARIAVRDGRPRVVEAAPPELVHIEPTGAHEAAALMRSLVQKPFDLERGPLWRCALLDGPAPVLVLCMHHVIGDYVSLQVMLADLERGLTLGSLPPPSHEHADLVAREAAATTGATAERNRAYWARELADLPVLALPSPSARPARPTQRGTQHEIAIPAGTVEALQRLARAEGTTLHAVLLAGLHALLHRWTGQEDIAIGTPVSTRRPPWAAGIVGYCTNPVPVRAQPVGDRPFVELLREVRDRVIAAVAHELPFPAVVRAAGAPRDPNRTPVFQALFALEKTGGGERDGVLGASPDGRVRFAEMDAEPLLVRPAHVPFDLAVVAEQTKLGVTAAVQVSHDALRGDCAARIADQWVRLLGDAVRRPSAPIGRLDLMGPDEQRFVVHEVNRTTAGGPARCLHELFAQQAKRTPDADALVDGHRAVSYGELLGRAAAIAHRLREEGIRPERRVGLHAARGADMIAAVTHDAVTARTLIANLHRAGRPLEAALGVYGRHRRSVYERMPLLAALAQAGYYEDRCWGEWYGDEALDVLEQASELAARSIPAAPRPGRTLQPR